MIDWQEYWRDFPQRFAEQDFCRQVGRTANGGQPTDDAELRVVLEEIVSLLELGPDDTLVDLCCGNGLLTAHLASHCDAVIGIDFSEPMIRIATEHHAAENVRYSRASVLDLESLTDVTLNKACMIESLAYFDGDQLGAILDGISSRSDGAARALFSGVLDDEAKWSFFNTPERRAAYEEQRRQGQEIMGRWWTREELRDIGAQHGYACRFSMQDPRLNTAHYRFNVVMDLEHGHV